MDGNYNTLLQQIENGISELRLPNSPENLYDPIRYILDLGAKRIRPALVLVGTQLTGGNIVKSLPQALGIEMFHNFTLLHDDIMDSANLRRGKPAVHKKWNSNIAILSGDVMLVKSFELMTKANSEQLPVILNLFSQTATEVCEGQQLDMDYANNDQINLDQYHKMIRLKTAVLLGCSLKMGGVRSNATPDKLELLYKLGETMGLAFQLKDDLLDAFGSTSFGKIKGGDIIEGKRTWLTLKCKEIANAEDKNRLLIAFNSKSRNDRVSEVLELYEKYDIQGRGEQEVKKYSSKAMKLIKQLNGDNLAENTLKQLVLSLAERKS